MSLPAKLKILYTQFERNLRTNYELTGDEKNLLKIILKFLFDFDIRDQDFWNLPRKFQNDFKKFVADRFFKHEAGRSDDYRTMYHDLSVHSDNLSTFSAMSSNAKSTCGQSNFMRVNSDAKNTSKRANPQTPKFGMRKVSMFKPVQPAMGHPRQFGYLEAEGQSMARVKSFQPSSNFLHVKPSQKLKKRIKKKSRGSIKIRVRETKPGIIRYVEPGFFVESLIPGRAVNRPNQSISFKISRFALSDLLDDDMRISLLQDYLRKRERLNLICKRKKKMHSKTKRNDEKTKKIFKKAVKTLFRQFKATPGRVK